MLRSSEIAHRCPIVGRIDLLRKLAGAGEEEAANAVAAAERTDCGCVGVETSGLESMRAKAKWVETVRCDGAMKGLLSMVEEAKSYSGTIEDRVWEVDDAITASLLIVRLCEIKWLEDEDIDVVVEVLRSESVRLMYFATICHNTDLRNVGRGYLSLGTMRLMFRIVEKWPFTSGKVQGIIRDSSNIHGLFANQMTFVSVVLSDVYLRFLTCRTLWNGRGAGFALAESTVGAVALMVSAMARIMDAEPKFRRVFRSSAVWEFASFVSSSKCGAPTVKAGVVSDNSICGFISGVLGSGEKLAPLSQDARLDILRCQPLSTFSDKRFAKAMMSFVDVVQRDMDIDSGYLADEARQVCAIVRGVLHGTCDPTALVHGETIASLCKNSPKSLEFVNNISSLCSKCTKRCKCVECGASQMSEECNECSWPCMCSECSSKYMCEGCDTLRVCCGCDKQQLLEDEHGWKYHHESKELCTYGKCGECGLCSGGCESGCACGEVCGM